MVGFWVTVVFAIICATIALCIYMCLCATEGVKMFEDPKYAKRISELEYKVADLEAVVKAFVVGEKK